MNDDTIECEGKDLLQVVDADQATPGMSLSERQSIANEQLRAATRVIERELGKARAHAKLLTVGTREADH